MNRQSVIFRSKHRRGLSGAAHENAVCNRDPRPYSARPISSSQWQMIMRHWRACPSVSDFPAAASNGPAAGHNRLQNGPQRRRAWRPISNHAGRPGAGFLSDANKQKVGRMQRAMGRHPAQQTQGMMGNIARLARQAQCLELIFYDQIYVDRCEPPGRDPRRCC